MALSLLGSIPLRTIKKYQNHLRVVFHLVRNVVLSNIRRFPLRYKYELSTQPYRLSL